MTGIVCSYTPFALQIEETMDVVRREMALLTEVDQPGSMIDKCVKGRRMKSTRM